MASFNKVILIGHLTRDPEIRVFGNGGKVAAFGFAVNNRKKNAQTNQWEEVPMFIDVDVFNRGENGTLANIVEQYCRKGTQICIEGKLHLDQWDDKTTGQKRSKHKVVADSITLLGAKQTPGGEDGESYSAPRPAGRGAGAPAKPARSYGPPPEDPGEAPASSGGEDSEIPF
jgi:single-strand DNA-binding protein